MEQVVGRSELRSEDSSPASSPEAETLHAFQTLNDFDFVQSTEADISTDLREENGGDDGLLDFRLFAATRPLDQSKEIEAAQKIRYRSSSVDNGSIGFVQPDRRSSYYFAKSISDLEQERFEASALSGHQVLALSKTPRPGSAYSWKVLEVPPSTKTQSHDISGAEYLRKLVDEDKAKKRTRPGKKYRIKLRTKHAVLKERKDAARAIANANEAAEREKRTRRNREKKVKKKLREKAKKVGGGNQAEDADAEADDIGDS